MTTVSHLETGVATEWSPSSDAGTVMVPAAQPGKWTPVWIRWHAVIKDLVPIGYQDETGFNYGEEPKPNTAANLGEGLA